MVRLRRRRTPAIIPGLALALALTCSWGPPSRAERNDLRLINLCPVSGGTACPWVVQSAGSGRISFAADPQATSRFRSLMSELGVVAAPRLQTPADTLGFAGLQFSAELEITQISREKSFWDGVEGVTPSNPRSSRPDPWLTTMGLFVRKGMWFPVPALEWGVGAVNILQSGMWAVQGYLKLALHEGFHDWILPSAAVRVGFSRLIGTDQVTLTVSSIDLLISKAFSIAGTARLEPFAGWDFLFIDARNGVIDPPPGTTANFGGTFTFSRQDAITRDRVYGGVKLKLAVLFLVAQLAVARSGRSSDGSATGNGARDMSGTQASASLSAGFDF